jgi:CHAD domain-containing protein
VANERIWRVYRRALKEGGAIGPETPAEDLHELRKTCKKLRYLMEFFQSLYPAEEIKLLIKALKVLQENLGEFQDLEVQGSQLKCFSQQMMEESRVSAATLLAMGMLVADLMKRQHQAREGFATRFKAFTEPSTRALFKKLFAARPQEVTLAP